MHIIPFFRRRLHTLFGVQARVPAIALRSSAQVSRRPAFARPGPLRWHINPVSGRLECRLVARGWQQAEPTSLLEDMGSYFALYRFGRALT